MEHVHWCTGVRDRLEVGRVGGWGQPVVLNRSRELTGDDNWL